jgi:hypothetical protein
MTASITRSWVRKILVCCAWLACAGMLRSVTAQTDALAGRWVASEPDHGVVITLAIGPSSTLIFPGFRQNGRVETLTLAVRNLQTTQQAATFAVDLPENEGALELELRLAGSDGLGVLRIIRVDGEQADDDMPTWTLRKTR